MLWQKDGLKAEINAPLASVIFKAVTEDPETAKASTA